MSNDERNNEQNAPGVLNKLQMEAMMAEILKTLRATDLNNPNMFFNAGQNSQARRLAREKRRGKRIATSSIDVDDDSSGRDTLPTFQERSVHNLSDQNMSPTRSVTRRLPRTATDDNLGNLKLRVPAFEGKNDPDAYLEWEKKMEHLFECQRFSEAKKVKLAVTEFSGYALHWWDQILTTRRRTGEAVVASWFELKTLMKKRFVPSHYSRDVHQKLSYNGGSAMLYCRLLRLQC